MTTWILIILLSQAGSQGGGAVTSIEFTTQDACEVAMRRTNDTHLNKRFDQIKQIDAYCVQK